PLAICAAVLPFPYCFDESGFGPLPVHVALEPVPPPVKQCVGLVPVVALLGFTPGVDVEAFVACFVCPGELLVLAAGAAAGGVAFLACPGGCPAGAAAGCAAGAAAGCDAAGVWSCFACPGGVPAF